jgi:hypothetical protein
MRQHCRRRGNACPSAMVARGQRRQAMPVGVVGSVATGSSNAASQRFGNRGTDAAAAIGGRASTKSSVAGLVVAKQGASLVYQAKTYFGISYVGRQFTDKSRRSIVSAIFSASFGVLGMLQADEPLRRPRPGSLPPSTVFCKGPPGPPSAPMEPFLNDTQARQIWQRGPQARW